MWVFSGSSQSQTNQAIDSSRKNSSRGGWAGVEEMQIPPKMLYEHVKISGINKKKQVKLSGVFKKEILQDFLGWKLVFTATVITLKCKNSRGSGFRKVYQLLLFEFFSNSSIPKRANIAHIIWLMTDRGDCLS